MSTHALENEWKNLRDRIEAMRSGQKYNRIEQAHRRELRRRLVEVVQVGEEVAEQFPSTAEHLAEVNARYREQIADLDARIRYAEDEIRTTGRAITQIDMKMMNLSTRIQDTADREGVVG